jgi:hypothetical protein
MSMIVLTESELKIKMAQIYKEEKLNQVRKKWDGFTKTEKMFVVEFYKILHPESKILSETKWYNWVGDIAGLIPGLELVNIVNGVSYWRQGEKLFALLSFLAGVPGLSLLLGPVKVLLKGGGAAAKALKGAVAVGDAAKLATVAKESSVIGRLVAGVGSWGVKLLEMLGKLLEKVPFLKTIINGIKSIIRLFKSANGQMVSSSKGQQFKASSPQGKMILTKGGTVPLNKVGTTQPTGMKSDDPITNIISSMFGSK